MDDRTRQFAQGLAGVDMVYFGMAEQLDEEAKQNSWKEYSYSMEYPEERKQGKHPSTFGNFLEGFSFDLREQGYDISRGELAEMLEVYRWFTAMGGNQQTWAYLGLALLKQIYRQYKDPTPATAQILQEAIASKQQHGKYHLPSFQKLAPVTFSIEVEEQGDKYQLRSLNAIRDGEAQKNLWDKPMLHYLAKRMRASVIIRN